MHKPLTLLSTPSPQSHLFPQYSLGLTHSYNCIKMAPQCQFSRYLTLANSVGDSSRFRGVHELTMIEYPVLSDRCFHHGTRSFHLTPLPRVSHAPNGRTDPSISSTTLCGTCPACLAMSRQAPNSRTDPSFHPLPRVVYVLHFLP